LRRRPRLVTGPEIDEVAVDRDDGRRGVSGRKVSNALALLELGLELLDLSCERLDLRVGWSRVVAVPVEIVPESRDLVLGVKCLRLGLPSTLFCLLMLAE
jgi:hypothetical protein